MDENANTHEKGVSMISTGLSADQSPKKVHLDRFKELRIEWRDGTDTSYTIDRLRAACPCASCRQSRESAADPLAILDGNAPSPGVHVVEMTPVGHYALSFNFSDGHRTGIYSYEYLRELASDTDSDSDPTSASPPPITD